MKWEEFEHEITEKSQLKWNPSSFNFYNSTDKTFVINGVLKELKGRMKINSTAFSFQGQGFSPTCKISSTDVALIDYIDDGEVRDVYYHLKKGRNNRDNFLLK